MLDGIDDAEHIREEYSSILRAQLSTYELILIFYNALHPEFQNTSKRLIEKYAIGKIVDPFANSNKLATVTNDLDTQYDTDYHMDALDFLKIFDDNSVDTVLYDPPYSPRQVSECYKNLGQTVNMQTTQALYWSKQKEQIGRIVKKDGIVITCSWNSGGIGKKYGFEIQEILLVPHGGWHNDTIVVVEKKIE